jgi:uncharacterized protein (DUF58 family)
VERGPKRAVVLPSPGVFFAPTFRARLGRLLALSASRRERSEGAGRARLAGGGSEFLGYRPYRYGEDLRALDWNLLARLGRPYVRVSAREASERWLVAVDASASMGVGRPGKLQLAAEAAVALCALGVRERATVTLHVHGGEPLCVAQRPGAIEGWMRALERLRAGGEQGLGALARSLATVRGGGRWFFLGDFLDCTPAEVLRLSRPGRELALARILAREELGPASGLSVRWIDAESGAALARDASPASLLRYERALAAELERWGLAARGARAAHACWTSATPFETLVLSLCERMG